ncbi:MAG: methylenetetrahydromethanopterin dehydrogenase [Pirellulaceae bacterium]
MGKPKVLVQLDPDAHASVFDSVVAVDSGVDHLLTHAGVEPTQVRDLVHGAMFTRGGDDLRRTAIFIGGSNVAAGEALLKQTLDCFFGPMRVSVMLDASGANTTASAAVLAAGQHVKLKDATVLVLGATGPVGQRVVRLLAEEGAAVRVGSRSVERAQSVCDAVSGKLADAKLTPVSAGSSAEAGAALDGCTVVIAAGAAGVELLAEKEFAAASLQVAIDLNAVPPAGIAGIAVTDKAARHGDVICYGAIGVGGLKMKIHKAAVKQLFKANDQVLDAVEIYNLGRQLLD